MAKPVEELKTKDKKSAQTLGRSLVLSIDQNERIVKFNKECEQISGYTKNDVLNKHPFDFLMPDRYREQWKKFLNYSRENKMMDNFKLPLLTRQGHEIMISWSSFPTKNNNGAVSDVNLVGDLVKDWNDVTEPSVKNQKIEIKSRTMDPGKTQDYETLYKTVKKLEKINAELERKNKGLEKNFKNLSVRWDDYRKKREEKDKQSGRPLNKSLYSMSELFGGKKRRQELEHMKHELDEREEILNKIESRLIAEKKKMNNQMIEFRNWREKIESLENEVENRWNELNKQEKLLTCEIAGTEAVSNDDIKDDIIVGRHDIINKIPDCAAVIQRGILKQVNGPFVDFIGYNTNEIVDKSLFDFIVPEGFSKVEKYYLNRLKGEDVTSYETVFLTKSNNKVPVEIIIKPTFFKGEKAEIAIVKKLDKKK